MLNKTHSLKHFVYLAGLRIYLDLLLLGLEEEMVEVCELSDNDR